MSVKIAVLAQMPNAAKARLRPERRRLAQGTQEYRKSRRIAAITGLYCAAAKGYKFQVRYRQRTGQVSQAGT
jgi:hypothetical protein